MMGGLEDVWSPMRKERKERKERMCVTLVKKLFF
jgi:hypothetical protein